MSKLLLTLLLVAAGVSHAGLPLPRVSGEPAWAQPKSAAVSLRAPGAATDNTAEVRFGFMDNARIDAVRELNSQQSFKALQIGINRDVRDELPGMSYPQLVWSSVPGGGKVARLVVSSPGAKALRVGLNVRALPAGAELRFAGSTNLQNVTGTITADELRKLRRDNPVYWTALTEGEQQVIEIFLPEGASTSAVKIEVDSASHILGSPSDGFKDVTLAKASGSCNRNTICETQTPAFVNAKNSVAKMIFTAAGSNGVLGSYLCTGTLLNDNDASSQIPYFYSANHCISTQTEASTLNTIWFYEGASCGATSPSGSTVTLSRGATLLFHEEQRDALLLRLNDNAPSGAYFSGWDPNTLTAGTAVTSIHHPQGDIKKVTLGTMVGFTNLSDFNGQPYSTMAWTLGTTEGGSSGSGVFSFDGTQYYLRGGLYGGSAACSNSGDVNNTNNRDFYSRFDQVYSSLRKYIDVDYTGVWGAPGEDGLGLSILRGTSGGLGVIWYQYTPQRQPTWFLLGGNWAGPATYVGTWLSYSATGYDVSFAASSVTSTAVGTATFNFTSPTTATMNYTLPGGVSGTKNLVKMDF